MFLTSDREKELTDKINKITGEDLGNIHFYRHENGSLDFIGIAIKKGNDCFCRTFRYCANCEKIIKKYKNAIQDELNVFVEISPF